jgi:predicted flavoprotein YhiN
LNNNIAIVGAGASGLLSSIILGRAGFKVTVFEKNKKVGRKILITGNGHCNISNENIKLSNFHSNDLDFVEYTLKQFTPYKFKEFFQDLGLELISNKNGRIYPQTLQASSVVNLLYYEASKVGVVFLLDTEIEKIDFLNKQFTLT